MTTTNLNLPLFAPTDGTHYTVMQIFAKLVSVPEFRHKALNEGAVMSLLRTRAFPVRNDDRLGVIMEMSVEMQCSDVVPSDEGLTVAETPKATYVIDCQFPMSWLIRDEPDPNELNGFSHSLWRMARGKREHWETDCVNATVPQLMKILDPSIIESGVSFSNHLYVCAQFMNNTWNDLVRGFGRREPTREFLRTGEGVSKDFLEETRDRQAMEMTKRHAAETIAMIKGWDGAFYHYRD